MVVCLVLLCGCDYIVLSKKLTCVIVWYAVLSLLLSPVFASASGVVFSERRVFHVWFCACVRLFCCLCLCHSLCLLFIILLFSTCGVYGLAFVVLFVVDLCVLFSCRFAL